jgi:hypothetical protein
MARKRENSPELEVVEEAARILFLTYGHEAVHMAALRCAELTKVGDTAGAASWKKILKNVQKLAAPNSQEHGRVN